jgi:hypothetical protein
MCWINNLGQQRRKDYKGEVGNDLQEAETADGTEEWRSV